LTDVADLFANFTDVKRVVVAFGFRFSVRDSRVFPSLMDDHTTQSAENLKSPRVFLKK
jgi:hypothetical protein